MDQNRYDSTHGEASRSQRVTFSDRLLDEEDEED